MLLLVGGLDALQWGAIVVASPFVLVLVLMCIGFLLDIRSDTRKALPSTDQDGLAASLPDRR
jgi:choline-glycine betaine transporter